MSSRALLARCFELGVELEVADGELLVRGRRAAVKHVMPEIRKHKPAMIQLVSKLAEYRQELFEERAAIMEFDGGLSRSEAERLAHRQSTGDLPS